jgi:hypothetical protein
MTAPVFSLDKSHLNYLTDESGNKTGVVIPIKTAFQELEGIEKGEIPAITLKAFLDEL